MKEIRPESAAAHAARIRGRIAELDAERTALTRELVQLTRRPAERMPNGDASMLTSTSPAADKIALFRSLFAGRADVFPRRWSVSDTGTDAFRRVVAAQLPCRS